MPMGMRLLIIRGIDRLRDRLVIHDQPLYRCDGARFDSEHSVFGLLRSSLLVRRLGSRLDLAAPNGRFSARVTLPTDATD